MNCGKDLKNQTPGEPADIDADLSSDSSLDMEENDIIETLSNAAKSANYEHFGNDNNVVSFPVNLNQEFTDSDRDLKDLCTKFVVDQFFGASDNLYNFMSIVVNTFSSSIKHYIKDNNLPDDSIVFIYKVCFNI